MYEILWHFMNTDDFISEDCNLEFEFRFIWGWGEYITESKLSLSQFLISDSSIAQTWVLSQFIVEKKKWPNTAGIDKLCGTKKLYVQWGAC